MGCANPEGATGWNIARQVALAAGCPVSVPGVTVNRFCSSGLQTIALAAQRDPRRRGRGLRRRRRRVDLLRAAGDEPAHAASTRSSMSTSPRSTGRCCRPPRPWRSATRSRASARTNTARAASSAPAPRRPPGSSADEIAPITVTMAGVDKATSALYTKEVTVERDEGMRADTTFEASRRSSRRCRAAWSRRATPASSPTARAPAW